ncbi:MAG: beta-lactamase family protein [Pseudomonadota bacterium]|uniref:serine hydrolase domain-containing protein n=1 Tax=Polaromonas sp. TaxID=1869339 RepID=UPI0025EC5CB9|nr:serine hydrolase [Polaromonas sp.]MDQ3272913.1 beta-lactamase family protein [Pseudomonadota bacterium]
MSEKNQTEQGASMNVFPSRLWHVTAALLLLTVPLSGMTQDRPYPGASWQGVTAPEALGWSREKLQVARQYAETIDSAAVMLIVNGQVLDEWGHTGTRYNVHSIRKSFLSGLIGIAVEEGRMALGSTLAQLGIDDNPPSLTAMEKQATVGDLIKARSGIYHAALYETPGMAARRPQRGSHAPGTFWYYNNWDFNALGTIYEQNTKGKIFEQFKARIAGPLGMEDFRLSDGEYVSGPSSDHRAYPFRMTARDMARFGLLFLRDGRWRGQQIVPAAWVKESTSVYSDAELDGGYGYMWWVAKDGRHLPSVRLPEGSFSAQGHGGHLILVIPPLDLVIVHRVDTDRPGKQVSDPQLGELVRLILAAKKQD